jgi:hypothetical protein
MTVFRITWTKFSPDPFQISLRFKLVTVEGRCELRFVRRCVPVAGAAVKSLFLFQRLFFWRNVLGTEAKIIQINRINEL